MPPTLSGPGAQKAGKGKVVVLAACAQACALTATGTVSVPGATTARTIAASAKVFALRKATARLGGAGKARLSLAIPASASKSIKRALAAGKRVVAKVTVRASYDSGSASAKRKIRLTR